MKTYTAILASIMFNGCGYYPHNFAAIATPSDKTFTITGTILPTSEVKKENRYDDIKRIESIGMATYKFGGDKVFLAPSLYYIGIGSGIGYILDTKTVLSGFAGVSAYPISVASGISISQALYSHYFIEYRYNYSKLHYMDCAFTCSEAEEGEYRPYSTFNIATLFGVFYSQLNVAITALNKRYMTYGLSIGVQISK